jgi:hypothetical protein
MRVGVLPVIGASMLDRVDTGALKNLLHVEAIGFPAGLRAICHGRLKQWNVMASSF